MRDALITSGHANADEIAGMEEMPSIEIKETQSRGRALASKERKP